MFFLARRAPHLVPSFPSLQDTQIRALLVTFACTIWWFNQLFMITQFAAFARYITPVLGDSGKESWIFNSFNVVTIVLAPIFASQADLYGRVSRPRPRPQGRHPLVD